MRRRARGASGLTLIEVLVTLLLMMVGAAGLIAASGATMSAGRFSRDLSSASALALSKVEELRLVTPVPTVPASAACAALLPCGGGGVGEAVNDVGGTTGASRFTRCWCATAVGTDVSVAILVAWNDNEQTPTSCTNPSHCVRMDLRRGP